MPETDHNKLSIKGVETPTDDFRKCVFVIDELLSCYDCYQFLIPVPKTALVYHHEIKRPMDFRTLERNLYDNKYKTYQRFVSDLQLIWNNARQFHRSFDPIYQQADNLCRRFEALSTYLSGGAQPYYLSIAIGDKEAVSNQPLPEEVVSHDSPSPPPPPPPPFPLYKEIELPRKSNLYFVQALSEQDCATKKLRGFSNVRALFQCLNASFFSCTDTPDQSQLPLPRFYIAKNRTLLNQAKTDPQGALAILFNVQLTPLKSEASQKNLYRLQSTVVLCEPVGETHSFDDSSMDKSTKYEFCPKAWLKLKVLHVVHNATATVDSDLDRNYLKKPYNTFRLSTKTPADPKKVSNHELAKQFVRSILEPVSPNQNDPITQHSQNGTLNVSKEQTAPKSLPTSDPTQQPLSNQLRELKNQTPDVEQTKSTTNNNNNNRSEPKSTAVSRKLASQEPVDQASAKKPRLATRPTPVPERHPSPSKSPASPSPPTLETSSSSITKQPKPHSNPLDSPLIESPKPTTPIKTLTSIRLVVKQPDSDANKGSRDNKSTTERASRTEPTSSHSPPPHQSTPQLSPSTKHMKTPSYTSDRNGLKDEDSDSTASYEYSEDEIEEENKPIEKTSSTTHSYREPQSAFMIETTDRKDDQEPSDIEDDYYDASASIEEMEASSHQPLSSQPPVVYERYLEPVVQQEKNKPQKPQLPEDQKQYYLEASKQLWLKITEFAQQKNVPVTSVDQYRAYASSSTPNAEGFFKNVFFDPHDSRKVVQTFKKMTITQRTTEIAGLLALKGLPHMGQITHVLKEDHGEIIGLCMERYQKTLKQYTHAHSHHRLTAHQKMDLVIQMLESLSTLHQVGLAHRDLSEVNFMVNQTEHKLRDGSPKAALYLIDFGKSTFTTAEAYRNWWVEQPRLEHEVYDDEIIPRTKEELDQWCQRLPWIPSRPDHGYKLYRSIQTLPKSRNDTEGLGWLINPIAEDLYSIGTLIWKTFAETEPWYGIMDSDIRALRDIVSDDYSLQKTLEREVNGQLSRELLLKFLKVNPQQRESAATVLAWLKDEDVQDRLIVEWERNAPVARQKRHAKALSKPEDGPNADSDAFQRKRHKTGYNEADT